MAHSNAPPVVHPETYARDGEPPHGPGSSLRAALRGWPIAPAAGARPRRRLRQPNERADSRFLLSPMLMWSASPARWIGLVLTAASLTAPAREPIRAQSADTAVFAAPPQTHLAFVDVTVIPMDRDRSLPGCRRSSAQDSRRTQYLRRRPAVRPNISAGRTIWARLLSGGARISAPSTPTLRAT